MIKGYYKCDCGKEFDNPQKFNAHKQGCESHIVQKYGSLAVYYKQKNRNHNKGKIIKERARIRKEETLQAWVSEKHVCETCGKIMTEKFGSGRFCSRSCANLRIVSSATRQKIKNAAENKAVNLKNAKRNAYMISPKHCVICGKTISYDKRANQTCSKECRKQLQSLKMSTKLSLCDIHSTVRGRYKYGTYKGVTCDSSWELAFVMYCLDNHITFTRNSRDSFYYEYKGKPHKFFPDFIVEGTYYEIKNYRSDLTDAKVRYFPKDKQLNVLYYEDVSKYIAYATSTYGKFYYCLYDTSKPSWMNSQFKSG